MINLYDHQLEALDNLKTGSILCGGVGSGKSLTSLAYFIKSCGGDININGSSDYSPMTKPKDLYIITTARKRDSLEWHSECAHFALSTKKELSVDGVTVVIDSWNNIKKYKEVVNAFFIFDEQRIVGTGTWVKSFIKISKSNDWILLSATPGDVWMDYVPVFIGNKFYKNHREFIRTHVVYDNFSKFPKIDHYVNVGILEKHKKDILVDMSFERLTTSIHKDIIASYDTYKFNRVMKDRWNVYENKPIKDISQLYHLMRKVVNEDTNRLAIVKHLASIHKKIIIFYNFNYELDILRTLNKDYEVAEWNGHNHDPLPTSDSWIYLVQYLAGAEGWNCITTNVVVYYSLNYSYKLTAQAGGRIDRLNTPFRELYYYHIISKSPIDIAIQKSLKQKRNFQENNFIKE